MCFNYKVCLAFLLLCVLWPNVTALGQTGRGAATGQRSSLPTREAAASASAARREWDAKRDWLRFTTGLLGDTTIKDNIKELLASGMKPETWDRYGRTALHAAVMLGQVELARFLLSKGADINVRDREGRTPLMVSASVGGFDLFQGFATTAPWELSWTERLCGAESPESLKGNLRMLEDWYSMVVAQRPMLRLLLDSGADINVKDNEGRDAFDHAALGGPTDFDRLIIGSAKANKTTACELSMSQAPEVRGIRLGMNLKGAAARLHPSSVSEPDSCGRQTLEFDWADDLLGQTAPRPQEFSGVRRLRLGFLDGRLAYFRVTYDGEAAPMRLDQFRATISSSLKLPSMWRRAGDAGTWDQPYSVGCDGFKVMSGYNVGPYVEFHDTTALDVLLKRSSEARIRRLREREAERERRRRVFKP
jgi:ankyrin repeat protein